MKEGDDHLSSKNAISNLPITCRAELSRANPTFKRIASMSTTQKDLPVASCPARCLLIWVRPELATFFHLFALFAPLTPPLPSLRAWNSRRHQGFSLRKPLPSRQLHLWSIWCWYVRSLLPLPSPRTLSAFCTIFPSLALLLFPSLVHPPLGPSSPPSTSQNHCALSKTHIHTISAVSDASPRFFTTGNNWAKGTFRALSFYICDLALEAQREANKRTSKIDHYQMVKLPNGKLEDVDVRVWRNWLLEIWRISSNREKNFDRPTHSLQTLGIARTRSGIR